MCSQAVKILYGAQILEVFGVASKEQCTIMNLANCEFIQKLVKRLAKDIRESDSTVKKFFNETELQLIEKVDELQSVFEELAILDRKEKREINAALQNENIE